MNGDNRASISAGGDTPSPLERLILWNTFRNLGNSALGRATVLVPVFGYLILFNENVIHFLELSSRYFPAEQTIEAFTHTTRRLFWLYVGLFTVGVGSTLFQFFCPKTVKLFSVATEFVAARERSSRAEQERLLNLCRSSSTRAAQRRRHELPLNLDGDHDVKLMYEIFYYIENRSRPLARYAVAALYGFGIVVLGLLSLGAFYRIVRSYFGW